MMETFDLPDWPGLLICIAEVDQLSLCSDARAASLPM